MFEYFRNLVPAAVGSVFEGVVATVGQADWSTIWPLGDDEVFVDDALGFGLEAHALPN